ncbi:circadian clock-controlled protein daywake-like isoform X3 [Frankliniella occidentalis]|uniref:Circadian clock-controlled protein daywake-like isoform X1 n=1 Tax=Frankliniella occidentalis TaxID=133901 RepID=A0A6J1SP84_FRAOC|nr:circadian clock-controlled protein daywake-like isoform X1 [Frankliniella occidentalis]XP_052123125.1 circadian clock-controlled protein daywake-like isoform X2 [Frankliniella occidentalis]XP_052123126.1 circadian clock-controlled protein daywake-like isoform X3 [Frankliniella occidentalis]
MAIRTIIGVLVLVAAAAQAKKIPDYLQTCKRSDPKYDDCLTKAIVAAKPYLNKGIPKLHVPPYEPLEFPALDVDRNLDNIQVKAHLTNIKIYGASGFIIDSLKSDLSKHEVTATVTIPKVFVDMDYNVQGRLLVVPIVGFGHFKGNFTNCKAVIKGNAKIFNNKKNVKHLKLDKFHAKLAVGDTAFDIQNKDTRSAAIANAANAFIAQNRRQVIQIVLPIVEETMDEVVRQIGDDILSTMPYHEILPE